MPAQLEYKDGLGQWQPLDLKTLATKAGQSWDSTNNDTGEVKANVWLKSTDVATTLATVKVTVITKDIKSQALTNLFKLNIKTQTQDLRTARRTEAWFAALERVETLNACGANQAKFDKEWRTTLFLAKTLGFYSVWVLVFRATKAKDPTNASLATKFVTDTNVANYFPNTDTTEVP
jgi:hypothetical protein